MTTEERNIGRSKQRPYFFCHSFGNCAMVADVVIIRVGEDGDAAFLDRESYFLALNIA